MTKNIKNTRTKIMHLRQALLLKNKMLKNAVKWHKSGS